MAQKMDLLALDATVQAVRAGEVGEGCAVVAKEVKELAKQTAAATEGVGRKIERFRRTPRGRSRPGEHDLADDRDGNGRASGDHERDVHQPAGTRGPVQAGDRKAVQNALPGQPFNPVRKRSAESRSRRRIGSRIGSR